MSSSYFPIGHKTEAGRELLFFVSRLEDISNPVFQNAVEGSDGQYDNSTYDGQYCAHLQIAASLIEDCVSHYGCGCEKDKKKKDD